MWYDRQVFGLSWAEWGFTLMILISTVGIFLSLTVIFARPANASRISVDENILIEDSGLGGQVHDSGQAWTNVKILPATPDGVMSYLIPFTLDIGQGTRWYWACVAENGALWLIEAESERACAIIFDTRMPPKDFILADLSDFAGARTCTSCHKVVPPELPGPWDDPDSIVGNASVATGVYDRSEPYELRKGREAVFFTWYDMHRVGTKERTTVQIAITNKAGGNFDLDFNWKDSPAIRGKHGFSLGRSKSLVTGSQLAMSDHWCFREGFGKVCPRE